MTGHEMTRHEMSAPATTGPASAIDHGLFPPAVRRAVLIAVSALLLLATYLVAVRGTALLVDLAAGAAGLFCL